MKTRSDFDSYTRPLALMPEANAKNSNQPQRPKRNSMTTTNNALKQVVQVYGAPIF